MYAKNKGFLGLAFIFCCSVFGQHQKPIEWAFQFGTQPLKQGHYTSVSSTEQYREQGYGFDFNSIDAVQMHKKGMIADSSIYFSVSLPAGNYLVSMVFGSEYSPSVNSVKAESKRLMVNQLRLKKGQYKTSEFVVHLQTKKIDSTHNINLKPREENALNWDTKLSFEFLKGTAVTHLLIHELNEVPTLFLAGDSTVADQDLSPWASWGQFITQYMQPSIVVANYAASGASLSSFKARKRWDKILHLIKQGDYVMIEFGHNDQKIKNEGSGPWSSYSDLLTYYVESARAKGGIPILLTPLQRRVFNKTKGIKPTHGDYPAAVRAVANSLSVPLIDLTEISTALYESWGVDDSKNAFVHYPENSFPGQKKALADNTHFNDFGAHEIALCVIQGVKELDLVLKRHLKPLPRYNPKSPGSIKNWTLPMSARFEVIKPEGN